MNSQAYPVLVNEDGIGAYEENNVNYYPGYQHEQQPNEY